ncbi:MAG: tRNA 2-thiouridine(34) synthase MnmA [Bacteroidota bacterium]
MSRHGRVLVAMSGGVDSSVAAGLLHEAGYEVVGVTMKTWDYETSLGGSGVSRKQSGCCSLDDMNDARAVAVRLGAAHVVVDIRDEFGGWVVDRFASDYLAGRTPNPCVLCNTHIKWAALLKRADALGCQHIATGHYAQVRRLRGDAEADRYVVSRGLDRTKDQSYVLWGVAQDHLARTLFPLGGLAKTEIRQMATDMGFDHVAAKPDSYEICFVPDDDYRGFLKRREGTLDALAGGPFVHAETGETVGRHEGYPFYTVGQRRGLGIALGEPTYVVRIEPETNTVVVGPRSALDGRVLTATEVVWGAADRLGEEVRVTGQIRHRDPGAPVVLRQTGPDAVEAVFEAPRSAIAPGQAAVFYDGDDVLCGGWIDTAPTLSPTEADEFVALPTL